MILMPSRPSLFVFTVFLSAVFLSQAITASAQLQSPGDAAYRRGAALVDAKNYTGAMAELKEAIRLDPRHAMAFHYVGIAQYYLKDYVVANAAFERALELNVANPHFAYIWIGDCQRAQGQYDKARSAYREAARVKPDYAPAFNGIGLAYHLQKDYENAVLFFVQAVRLDPRTGIYRKNIGMAYISAGKKDEAMKVYNALVPVDAKLANELLDEITKPTTTAAATKPRTPAESKWDEGFRFYNAKDYQKALASFQEALNLKPDFGHASHFLGMAYFQLKQYPLAIAAFENAIKLKYEYLYFSYEWIGDTRTQEKQYQKALAAYTEALRLKPDNAKFAAKIGDCHFSLKNYAEAVKSYESSIRLEPGNAITQASLGDTQFALGNYDKAIPPYTESVRLDPKYDWAWNKLGASQFRLKEYAKALPAFQTAVNLKPEDAIYQQNLGSAYVELGRKADALAVHKKLATLNKEYADYLLSYINRPPEPKTAEEFVARGEKLLADKDYYRAAEAFDKASQMKPDLVAAQRGLGAAYSARNLPTMALAAYEKALAIDANDPEIYYGLGVAKRGLLKFDESIAAFQKCIALKPKAATLAEAHFALGGLFLESRPKEALTEFQSVQRLKPDYPKLQLYIARALYNGNQYPDALALFLAELKKTPDDPELVYYAGMCYVRLGKKPEAVALYEKLVALGAFSQTNLNIWIKGMK